MARANCRCTLIRRNSQSSEDVVVCIKSSGTGKLSFNKFSYWQVWVGYFTGTDQKEVHGL